jgi:pimeloyl-ACP methyl ester carboxylesterase
VNREIDDIEALIDEAGGTASLYGHSSGASLGLDAAARLGGKVAKLAMYEAPYNDDAEARRAWAQYVSQLTAALAAGRRGDAVALFMSYTGMPADQIDGMRKQPFWAGLEAVAPTLRYDHAGVLGNDASIPSERASRVRVPALVMYGEESFPFMAGTARTLSQLIPRALLRALPGQTHEVAPGAVAPVLTEFLAG